MSQANQMPGMRTPVAAAPAAPVEVKKAKPIEVVADRPGFYNQVRLREGDHFEIRSEDDWGEWFHCVEPGMEKKRVAFLKEKKEAAQKRKSGEADA